MVRSEVPGVDCVLQWSPALGTGRGRGKHTGAHAVAAASMEPGPGDRERARRSWATKPAPRCFNGARPWGPGEGVAEVEETAPPSLVLQWSPALGTGRGETRSARLPGAPIMLQWSPALGTGRGVHRAAGGDSCGAASMEPGPGDREREPSAEFRTQTRLSRRDANGPVDDANRPLGSADARGFPRP